jgi:hypothetical protein
MATRSRPARRTTARKAASQAKRRPAARRKPAARRQPAARRGGSRIRWDRVGRIALTLVLLAVLYSYLNPAIDFVKTYTATTAAKAEFHEMLRENKRLHKRIQTAGDPVVISRRARAQGLVAEGETPIVVHGLGG